MLEKPDLQDEKVIACLEDEFELAVSKFDFLPLGADLNPFEIQFSSQQHHRNCRQLG